MRKEDRKSTEEAARAIESSLSFGQVVTEVDDSQLNFYIILSGATNWKEKSREDLVFMN